MPSLRFAWMMLLLASLLCCRGGTLVRFAVRGLPAEAVALIVQPTFAGRKAQQEAYAQDLSSFGLRAPVGASGLLRVEVEARDGAGQARARGQAEVTLDGEALIEASVTLQPIPPLGTDEVLVEISLPGKDPGEVVSDPPGISCDASCQVRVPRGARYQLRARAAARSYFAVWGGACSGAEPACSIEAREGPLRIEAVFLRRVCSRNLCWEQPLPAGTPLTGVYVASASEAWASGPPRSVWRWNGRYWQVFSDVTFPIDIFGMYGSAPDDVWIAGSGVLRWNGAAYRDPGGILGVVLSIAGSGRDNIWLANTDNAALRWDGSQFERHCFRGSMGVCQDIQGYVRSLWVPGPGRAWAGGEGKIFRWDGTAWASETIAAGFGVFTGLWGSGGPGSEDIWATARQIARRQNGAWAQVVLAGVTTQAIGVWGSAADDVWLVGLGGQILHHGPSGLRTEPRVSSTHLNAVSGADRELVWAVGEGGTTLRLAPGRSTAVTGALDTESVRDVWAASATDVWVVGDAGVARHDGVSLRREQDPAFEGTSGFASVWGSAPDDVWLVGKRGERVHWDGKTYSRAGSAATRPNAISGSARDNVWVVGGGGYCERWDGAVWTPRATGTTEDLHAVWSRSPTEVIVGGQRGTLMRWDGTRFAPAMLAPGDLGPGDRIEDIWGGPAAGDLIWAVTDTGKHISYEGGSWQVRVELGGIPLYGIWGSARDDVWVVGARGVLGRYDGTRWNTLEYDQAGGLGASFSKVVGAGADLWVVGPNGTIARRAR